MICALQTAKLIKEGSLTAKAAVEASLNKIKELNGQINAFLEIFEPQALSRAREIDKSDKRGRLCGVPVAIKDNMMFKGHVCSCASKMLENYKAVYTATAVQKLLNEGAIIVGRTNMDEFAMGSSNENSAFGAVKNPLDLERVPGGSSGGSAAAVAAGMVPVALGSDTGGSIRQPAAFCGLYGIKPAYGRVSRHGLAAFASSTDQIGPISATLEDNALILDIISGKDDKDSTSQNQKFNGAQIKENKNLTVGVPKDFLESLNPEILARVKEAEEKLKAAGVKCKEISLPNARYALPCYYILTSGEASSNLARYDGLRYGAKAEAESLEEYYLKARENFGPEVKRRIMLGAFCLSSAHADEYYKKAQMVRDIIKRDFENAFKETDVIMTPTTPDVAFKAGEKSRDLIELYLSDLYTVPPSIAGIPALNVPFGRNGSNMPVGIQLVGNMWEEEKLYQIAKTLS